MDMSSPAPDETHGEEAPAAGPALEPPSWWTENPDARCGDEFLSGIRRLQADRDANPDSTTLSEMALCDPSGAVVGMSPKGSALETAYTSGASAELVVEAERLSAFIGKRGDPGHQIRAVRLAHRLKTLNRRLARYSGLRSTLPTVTVLRGAGSPERRVNALRLDLAAAEATANQAVRDSVAANGPPGAGSDPPPLKAAPTAPLLRTGPPSGWVRVAA